MSKKIYTVNITDERIKAFLESEKTKGVSFSTTIRKALFEMVERESLKNDMVQQPSQ